MVRGGVASSLVTWYAEGGVVVGDVAHERVGMVAVVSSLSLSLVSWYMGVASSLVMWHVVRHGLCFE